MIRRDLCKMARLVATLLFAAAGAVSVPIARGAAGPQAPLHQSEVAFTQPPGAARPVTAGAHFTWPFLVGDHDLWATVEVPAGGALDLVFRKVEPRIVPTGDGGFEFTQFHGRFSVLRLSAVAEGEALLTREQALFGGVAGGVLVQPGAPISILLEARGRTVRANVGGRWLGPFEAADDHGNTALVVHGGPGATALVHHWRIVPRVPDWRLPAAIWGALWALAIAMVAGAGEPRRVLPAIAALLAGAVLAHACVFRHLSPSAAPAPDALVAGGLCGLLPAIALLSKGRLLAVALASLLSLVLLELVARHERDRLEPLADPRLAECFNRASGQGPFDALSRRLRGKLEVHRIDGPRPRLLLLGGAESVLEPGEDREGYLSLQLQASLLRRGRQAHVVVGGTKVAHARQQVELFTRFYRDWRPEEIVLVISGTDEVDVPQAGTGFLLLDLLAGQTSRPATGSDLEAAIARLAAVSREDGSRAGVATAELPREQEQAVETACRAHGVRFVPGLVRNGALAPAKVDELGG
jgi:hypothetical protein